MAIETETATRFMAVTDVVNAFAPFETNRKVVNLYESGYLDQARQSFTLTLKSVAHKVKIDPALFAKPTAK